MDKKGTVLLLISAVSFLIAITIFYGAVDNFNPGGDMEYFGQFENNLFETYSEANLALNFIDASALLSWDSDNFEETFGKHLITFNELYNKSLALDDYSFTVNDDFAKGICNKQIIFSGENVNYSVYPSFLLKR